MIGMGYVMPPQVLTAEQTRAAANRAALEADGLVEIPAEPTPLSSLATPKLEAVDRGKLTAAAFRARKAFPGPIGMCLADHLTTWAELGFRYGGAGSVAKLMEAVMAAPFDDVTPAA